MYEQIALTPEERGTCPICGEPSTERERKPLGRSWCANGHCWRQAFKREWGIDWQGRREMTKVTEYLLIVEGTEAKF